MRLVPGSPVVGLLNASLILGPLAYLLLDTSYAVRGWWDAPTGAAHIVVAALYGLTALRLLTLVPLRLQPWLLVVAVLGVVGNAGVGDDTLHVGLGGNDLFDEGGPADLFKVMGFFFPLTLLIAAVGLRRVVPAWSTAVLAGAALFFPVAHVLNVSWLAVLDAGGVVVVLGHLFRSRHDLDPGAGQPRSESSEPRCTSAGLGSKSTSTRSKPLVR